MDVVIQYEDQDGRVLSDPFMKLPTRRELPDYYEIIKKPVDISKILNKIDDGKVNYRTNSFYLKSIIFSSYKVAWSSLHLFLKSMQHILEQAPFFLSCL